MHLLAVFIAFVIVAVLIWAFWGVFVFLMLVSTTMAVSMFCIWAFLEFIRSFFVKYEGLKLLWIGITFGIIWFALAYNCDPIPVMIGSAFGLMSNGYNVWSREKPIHPHELQQ